MSRVLSSNVELDQIVLEVADIFDYTFEGRSEFKCHSKPNLDNFSIGLIVGSSGSGKSTLLSEFGDEPQFSWD